LEAILKQTTLPRIRISSIGPEYANDHFFEVVQDERILPHFHYSIQSFSDNILKGMRRNYDRKQLDEILHKTKKLKKIPLAVSPDGEENLISIGADLIVGFPGETESDFLETLHAIKDYNITKLHAFPFSDHHKGENVPASLYPDQVPQEIKKERESRLLEIGDKVRNDFIAKNKGTTHQVLIEEHKQGKWRGRTENYIQVEIEGDYHKGEIISYTFT
jgi:tRNA A37 methylthiotransferase MiaB